MGIFDYIVAYLGVYICSLLSDSVLSVGICEYIQCAICGYIQLTVGLGICEYIHIVLSVAISWLSRN